LDETLKKQAKILAALDKVRQEMAEKGELPLPEDESGEQGGKEPA
jgi:hypothetical protein